MSKVLVVSDQQLMKDLVGVNAGKVACSSTGVSTERPIVIVGLGDGDDESSFMRGAKRVVIEQCGRGVVSLDELCREVGASRPTLYRRIRKETGMSPAAFVLALRLDLAGCLILAGFPVTEVALATGFVSASHFCRAFREHFGVAPSCLPGLNGVSEPASSACYPDRRVTFTSRACRSPERST